MCQPFGLKAINKDETFKTLTLFLLLHRSEFVSLFRGFRGIRLEL